MKHTLGIGSDERAALVKLYGQYEYKELDFDNEMIAARSHMKSINKLGADGWRVVTVDWHDLGAHFILERMKFSLSHALERVENEGKKP